MDPQVFTPGYQEMEIKPPDGKKKIFKFLGLVLLIGVFLWGLNLIKDRDTFKKPDTWVIPQSLNTALYRQSLLAEYGADGTLSAEELIKTATASGFIKPEAVKIGSRYLLSTGSSGQVQIELPTGKYDFKIVPVPGVDLTGVPKEVDIRADRVILNVGVTKGSGKIKYGQLAGQEDTNSQKATFIVTLFHDKNGNGKKDKGELSLPWAGITMSLK